MRKRILLLAGIVIAGALGGPVIFKPKPLIKNGTLSQNLEGWETNAGISIFRDPQKRDWRFYWMVLRTGGIPLLADVRNDHFTALGAGDTVGSVLSQNLTLDNKGGRYELSLLFAATGDAGTKAVVEIRVTGTNGSVLLREMITNTQPVKTYYVPRKQERVLTFDFEVPARTPAIKLSFADESPNRGIAVDPLIKNVALRKLH